MSILDETFAEDATNKLVNAIRCNSARQSNLCGLSADQYKSVIDIYYLVSESYINFFIENYYDNDVENTNKKMYEDMQSHGVTRMPNDYFTSLEEAQEVAEYVFTSPFPANLETMKKFLREVRSGILEFRCLYPIGDTNALELIKQLERWLF